MYLQTTHRPAPISIVPAPTRIAMRSGAFVLDSRCVIAPECDEASFEAQYLADKLGLRVIGSVKSDAETQPGLATVRLRLHESSAGSESYRLDVTPLEIVISASASAGLFYGIQSLLQLLPPSVYGRSPLENSAITVPCVQIEDAPRFGWRGAMLDVSRHFMPKAFVLKFIDMLALHKMNVLHLHLNDDQGWRIEIKKYPKLTSVGAYRDKTLIGRALQNPGDANFDANLEAFDRCAHGGFYTQDDLREMVAYAAARHITIVPEIEMPGHAQAAIAAYPELGCMEDAPDVSPRWGIHDTLFNTSEKTIAFLQDVLLEVMALFPSRYIHVGGDEAVKTQWENSAACQARMRALGLADVHAMQPWFIGRMDKFLNAQGRVLIGWDEILEGGLADNAVVMSWRGEKGGIEAARARHNVVMGPYTQTYFDYYQSENWEDEPLGFRGLVSLEMVYNYEPIPVGLPHQYAHYILGAQCQLWTEYMPTEQQVEYMAFPRLCALAEVVWSSRESKNYARFLERLQVHLRRLDYCDVHYRPLDQEAEAAKPKSIASEALPLVKI